jgi:hypothetical protein
VLRLPATHIRSLICFASGVHVILLASCFAACAPGRSEGTSGPGPLFNRRPKLPVHSHVDVNGTSQVPRRSILRLCPALRPRPNRRSLASLTVSSMLPPRFPRQELQRLMNFGALSRGFGTCCLRFKTGVASRVAKPGHSDLDLAQTYRKPLLNRNRRPAPASRDQQLGNLAPETSVANPRGTPSITVVIFV